MHHRDVAVSGVPAKCSIYDDTAKRYGRASVDSIPVIVTGVPPSVDPMFGETADMDGPTGAVGVGGCVAVVG